MTSEQDQAQEVREEPDVVDRENALDIEAVLGGVHRRRPGRDAGGERDGDVADTPPSIDTIVTLVTALADIQDRTPTEIRVPDLTQFTTSAAQRVTRAADPLRGEAASVAWTRQHIHLHPGAEPTLDGPFAACFYEPLTVALDENTADGQAIALGYQQISLPAARIDLTTVRDHDDHQDVTLIPAGDTPAVIRHAPELRSG